MISDIWKKEVFDLLKGGGFKKRSKTFYYSGDEIAVLVGLQKSDFSNQWFINVGFWLYSLGSIVPSKVELTHLYFRLERIFPKFREIILGGGDLDDNGDDLVKQLLALLKDVIFPQLISLSKMTNLKKAFDLGLSNKGLVRYEARVFLEGWKENGSHSTHDAK